MALRFLSFLFALVIAGAVSAFDPISESHRSAATNFFVPGSYQSLEEAYRAARVFQVLGIGQKKTAEQCQVVSKALKSSSTEVKDISNAIKISEVLKCQGLDASVAKDVSAKLQTAIKGANSLLDYYYALTGLVSIKNQGWMAGDCLLEDANSIFKSIKTLSQTDGTWKYESSEGESSAYAAGLALESMAAVITLAESEIKQATIDSVKNGISKLFDTQKSYDDGTLYFAEKAVDAKKGNGGSILATSSVTRGVTTFAAATSDRLKIAEEKIVGIAKFFLSLGIPGTSIEYYHQADALGHLNDNKIITPLILSFPATVLSLTSGDQLKVILSTVLGSLPPPMTIKLVQSLKLDGKDVRLTKDQELIFNSETSEYTLDFPSKNLDTGKYEMTFEAVPGEDILDSKYSTGGHIKTVVTVTAAVKFSNSEISIVDSDSGNTETIKRLDFLNDETVSLSANHLQKLHVSFELTTPAGKAFKPHQAFLILRHESKVEHTFILKASGKKFEATLDFLSLLDRFYYLSGEYKIDLAIGDETMENSILKSLGVLELDLPNASENAASKPPVNVDVTSRYGPRPEIEHIFRKPEKQPPAELSYAFLALTLVPLLGFVIGLFILGVNFKNFPTSGLPLISAILFHGGILAVLALYALFWIKLNLFTTLKYLGFLSIFLVAVGHNILSHLANMASKIKTHECFNIFP